MSHSSLSDPQEDLSQISAIQQEILESEWNFLSLSEWICGRSLQLLGASGAVVEWVEGDEMVYRAGAGKLGDAVGLRLKLRNSLSGQAVLSEQSLYSMECETDPRLDREACRRVGARSMICIPLLCKNKVVGILTAVSSEAHAFVERDVSVLHSIAELLSATFVRLEDGKIGIKSREELGPIPRKSA